MAGGKKRFIPLDSSPSGVINIQLGKHLTGFTIIEVIIGIAIVSIMILGTYQLYIGQQRIYVNQQKISELQQQMRGILNAMTREIRRAGFDPNSTEIFGFSQADSNLASFSYDSDEDGSLDSNEQLTFRITGGVFEYSKDGGSSWSSMPGEIVSLQFNYYDNAGALLAVPVVTSADIRLVQILLTGRIKLSAAGSVYHQQSLSCKVRLRNYD